MYEPRYWAETVSAYTILPCHLPMDICYSYPDRTFTLAGLMLSCLQVQLNSGYHWQQPVGCVYLYPEVYWIPTWLEC